MIKRFFPLILLAAGAQAGWGFALLGPTGNGGDAWQTAVIGYNLGYEDESSPFSPGGPVFLGDIGGPKNIGEGYRRNVTTNYYAYDANFLGFFGTTGATAADGAFAIMNNLTNVESYSTNLSEFPLNSQQFNYTAQSLFLTDIKSVTLHLLVEQMGLAQPERYTWTLSERFVPPGCPLTTLYLVLQRNYEISPTALNQVQYSPYVNGVLYSYYIVENCTGPNPLAYTVPFSVDPLAQEYTSVAANDGDNRGGVQFSSGGGLQVGGFYTGLTRDDVAGLRYLLQTNNVVRETAAAGSLLQSPGQTNLIQNFDYGTFYATALTNNPATVATLYPNLVVTLTSNYVSTVCTPNVVSYLTNYIGAPIGNPPQLVVVTNGTTCVAVQNYVYSLANVASVTNIFTNSTGSYLQTSFLGLKQTVGAPGGSTLVTNITLTALALTNVPAGDFFIIPTNYCGLNINTNPYILNGPVTATTNLITTATNSNGFVYSKSIVTFFTNHYYLYQPLTCTAAATGLYQGVDNIKFVRANYDSLIGQFFQPITNFYTMEVVSNSQLVTQTFRRVITQPDILLSANNQIAGNTFDGSVERNINFDVGNVLPGLAGPGVINSPVTFDYNKIGAAFNNGPLGAYTNSFSFLSQLTQYSALAWASYDSSTNPPVVYPNGTSLQNLENQILVQVSPASLPNGTSGVVYSTTTFTATGGSFQPPFTWSASALPSGLKLSAGGILSGTPTQSGTFDPVIQLTDSLSRTVQWTYTLTIQ